MTAFGVSRQARIVRLRGIAELLAESDFDSVGHLHNDDARFLMAEVQRLTRVERYAREVMWALEEHGPSIVGHLLDDDENSGERLRQALGMWCCESLRRMGTCACPEDKHA